MEGPGDGVPWTTDQIREHSSNWTLQGDSKLLLHLQKFSETLEGRSKKTKNNLDEMMSQLDFTHIALGNATNRFLALQHSQFVESRVYEEDISELVQNKTIETSKNESKIDPVAIAREAVLLGFDLLETHFEPLTTSQDFGDGNNGYILRPKDIYLDRPLPCLIGSSEFFKLDKNISETESEEGLLESSRSHSPSIASSQSLSQSPHAPNTIGSSWRSDSLQYNMGTPNSTEKDFSKDARVKSHGDLFGDTSEEENEIFSGSSKLFDTKSNDNISTNSATQDSTPKINKLLTTTESGLFSDEDDLFSNITAQKPKPKDNYSMLFNDGPPILDDIFDDYKKPRKQKNSLFDEDESDEDFRVTKTESKTKEVSSIFKEPHKPKIVNLFDDVPPDDFDNLMATSSPKDDESGAESKKKTKPVKNEKIDDIAKEIKKKTNIFDDDEEIIKPTSSKPIKNVQIDDLTNEIKKRSNIFDDDDDDDFMQSNSKYVSKDSITKDTRKKISIFDDDDFDFLQKKSSEVLKKENIDDLTKEIRNKTNVCNDDEIIKPGSAKPVKNVKIDDLTNEIKKRTNIFDDDDDEDDFMQSFNSKAKKNDSTNDTRKQVNVFGDNDETFTPTNNEPVKTENIDVLTKQIKKKVNIFDDENDDFLNSLKNDNRKSSIFDDLDDVDFMKPEIKVKADKAINKKNNILFNDDIDTFNDVKNSTVVNTVKTESVKSKDLRLFDDEPPIDFGFSENKIKTATKKKISLFDDDDDDDIFAELNKNKTKINDNLFSAKPAKETGAIPKKTVSLFNDDFIDAELPKIEVMEKKQRAEEIPKAVNLFRESPPELDLITKENSPSAAESKKSFGLFDDEEEDNTANLDFNEKVQNTSKIDKNVNIFDDNPPEIDHEKSDRFLNDDSRKSSNMSVNLFDDKPPEIDDVSKDDDSEDLFSKNTDKSTSKTNNNISIFDDEPPSDIFDGNDVNDDSENIISTQASSESTPANRNVTIYDNEPPLDLDFDYKLTRNRNIFNDSDDDLFSSRLTDNKNDENNYFVSTTSEKIDDDVVDDVKLGKDVSNVINKENIDKIPNLEKVNDGIVTSPRKTNEISEHLVKNLNISALLPGSKPPKKDVLADSIIHSSKDKDKFMVKNTENDILSDNSDITSSEKTLSSDYLVTGSSSNYKGSEQQPEITSPSHTTLHNSVIKERAKIKVKRRPSSRKARQESIRNSLISEDNLLQEESGVITEETNTEEMATSTNFEHDKESSSDASDMKNIATTSEPYLSKIQSSNVNNISIHDLEKVRKNRDKELDGIFDENKEQKKNRLFEDPLLSEALFSRNVTHSEETRKIDENLSKMSILANDGSVVDIFGNYKKESSKSHRFFDDDDDLFSKTDKKLNKKILEEEIDDSNIFNKSTKLNKTKNNHLFSDDEDDDLFSVKPKTKFESHSKFSGDDDSRKSVMNQPTKVTKKTAPSKTVNTKATPLFGDSDDDDSDLFKIPPLIPDVRKFSHHK